MSHSQRQQFKSNLSRSYLDYAAATGRALMLGTSDPGKWEKYLKDNHPSVKFKIVQGGIIVNPKKLLVPKLEDA